MSKWKETRELNIVQKISKLSKLLNNIDFDKFFVEPAKIKIKALEEICKNKQQENK